MAGLYNVKDRDITEEPAKLASNINSSVTTFAVETDDGAKLPSTNAVLLMVQFNDQTGTYREAQASGVLKSELIEMGSRSTDTLSSITRGLGASSAASFDAGSFVLNIISEEIYDRQSEHIRAAQNPYRTELLR